MSETPDYAARLRHLEIKLSAPPPAIGAYVPVLQTSNLVMTSGQLPFIGGEIAFTGKVGGNLELEQGASAARQCLINALSQLDAYLGSINRISRILRIEGYVQSAPGFSQQPQVINGASHLVHEIFGDAGRHTRIAVGVSELPLNASVELALWCEVRE